MTEVLPPMPNVALIEAARNIGVAASLADIDERVTQEIIDLLDQAQAKLTPTHESVPRQPFDYPARIRDEENGVWSAGQFNARVPHVPLKWNGEGAYAMWTSSPVDEGPPGSVHGGVSAFLLDVVSGGLMQILGMRVVTATLDVRYAKRVPLGVEVELRSWLERAEGRKQYVKAGIFVNGELAVSSEGLFVTI